MNNDMSFHRSVKCDGDGAKDDNHYMLMLVFRFWDVGGGFMSDFWIYYFNIYLLTLVPQNRMIAAHTPLENGVTYSNYDIRA